MFKINLASVSVNQAIAAETTRITTTILKMAKNVQNHPSHHCLSRKCKYFNTVLSKYNHKYSISIVCYMPYGDGLLVPLQYSSMHMNPRWWSYISTLAKLQIRTAYNLRHTIYFNLTSIQPDR